MTPYQQYWQMDRLVAHVYYKATSDECHAVILNAAHGNVQQPADNLVAV